MYPALRSQIPVSSRIRKELISLHIVNHWSELSYMGANSYFMRMPFSQSEKKVSLSISRIPTHRKMRVHGS